MNVALTFPYSIICAKSFNLPSYVCSTHHVFHCGVKSWDWCEKAVIINYLAWEELTTLQVMGCLSLGHLASSSTLLMMYGIDIFIWAEVFLHGLISEDELNKLTISSKCQWSQCFFWDLIICKNNLAEWFPMSDWNQCNPTHK